jgi:8-oxo-dGTP pyrophosphatase MutT (NUDIX family)
MTSAVPIRLAATLMPVRDGAGGLEVCLLRRNANSTWVAGLALFPGGAVDERDGTPALAERCVLPAGVRADELPGGLAPWAAAMRECFEEIGLLLAIDDAGDWAHQDPDRLRRLDALRGPLDAGAADLATVLAEEGLRLRVDLLRFVAHWVTPPGQARRYDTRFYVAPAPAGAPAAPDGTEIVAADWIVPSVAIAAHEAGELPMLPPTLGALHWLAPHASVRAAVAAAEAMGEIPRWTPGDIDDARGRVDAERPTGDAAIDQPAA